ncbi:hypothetical protein W911_05605 [Hyphomicrobium nitrativorans NL23]|uniref:Anaphase-promoting complex subunit 4 WD40 domain-containing protein n=1 Tax=Hyphomicrobium nitrativorans NL23 TaxID=1029756 RepID=V5SGK4_9HYPH|nr:PD40 domain-containing protein [Hyphomicrobium nitrativorans]AHB49996.1 hypothetical protein W911_05605 [Hyphomicrobium nitrativorans NL23]
MSVMFCRPFAFAVVALAAVAGAWPRASLTQELSGAEREEAAKALMRPVCADASLREKIAGDMIARGGEYEKATAKWDMDVVCEQIDLPTDPVHDTADRADDASHNNWIHDARWSPDGKLIATAGSDGTVRLWDVATGTTVRTIDINTFAAAEKNDEIKLPSMPKADDRVRVRAARFLGDGRRLVVAADSHPVRIFDIASGEPVAEVPYVQADPEWDMPPFIETTPNGLVVLGGYRGEIVVYDPEAKAERYRLPGMPNDYPKFAISEAAGYIATTARGTDRSVIVQLRKLETGALIWEAEAEGEPSAYSVAFSRDGARLAVAVRGNAYVYATAENKLINTLPVYPTFGSFDVTFTADGQRLIAALRHAQLWDIASGKRVHHFGPFSDLCHAIDVSPDGKYLVTGHMGSDGRIWEIDSGTFFRRLGKNVYPPG